MVSLPPDLSPPRSPSLSPAQSPHASPRSDGDPHNWEGSAQFLPLPNFPCSDARPPSFPTPPIEQ
eukprot:gene36088-53229_t